MSNFLDLWPGSWQLNKMTTTETKAIKLGNDLAAVAARFEATPEQLTQLEKEFGPLMLRGDDLGYMSELTRKFEVLTWAGA